MTALEALTIARKVCVAVTIDGDTVALAATNDPNKTILELLALHKTEVIKFLVPAPNLPEEQTAHVTSVHLWCVECGRFPDQLTKGVTIRHTISFFCDECLSAFSSNSTILACHKGLFDDG